MNIRPYRPADDKQWVYTKALSYLFSPFFDDRESSKPALETDIYEERIELVAEVGGQVIGLLDIDIYNQEYSRSYTYAPADKVAYFTNLAVHPDFQGQGIAQALYEQAYAQLVEKGVEKLAIFTRDGNAANHLYQKWGGKLVCQDWLVVGVPKDTPAFRFGVDFNKGRLALTDMQGSAISHYLREGIYIVSDEADLDNFDIEQVYQEFTYVVDIGIHP
ncbi:GNAT family N-acetyltransferase [Streptococcus caprae]|uniref:GNAT family N-acetyltransferase n=1 Tax=Streptococcus caprae TaxID=1640501 RepID=A0ABV8CTJ1_9STRE